MTDQTPPAAGYDSETTYDVRLTQVVLYKGAKLLPRFEHQILGRALNVIVEEYGEGAIDAATPRT